MGAHIGANRSECKLEGAKPQRALRTVFPKPCSRVRSPLPGGSGQECSGVTGPVWEAHEERLRPTFLPIQDLEPAASTGPVSAPAAAPVSTPIAVPGIASVAASAAGIPITTTRVRRIAAFYIRAHVVSRLRSVA